MCNINLESANQKMKHLWTIRSLFKMKPNKYKFHSLLFLSNSFAKFPKILKKKTNSYRLKWIQISVMNAANFRYSINFLLFSFGLLYLTIPQNFCKMFYNFFYNIQYVFFVRYFIVSAPVSFKILLLTYFWVLFELSNPTQIQYIDT